MIIDDEIAAKQAELEALEIRKAALNEFSQIKRNAIELHEVLCRSNHDDGCGWGWEYNGPYGHDWNGYAHRRWLDHAMQVGERFPELTIEEFVELARFIRSIT